MNESDYMRGYRDGFRNGSSAERQVFAGLVGGLLTFVILGWMML